MAKVNVDDDHATAVCMGLTVRVFCNGSRQRDSIMNIALIMTMMTFTIIISCVATQPIERKRMSVQTCHQSHLSVCLSGGCIVAKRLIGSGCG